MVLQTQLACTPIELFNNSVSFKVNLTSFILDREGLLLLLLMTSNRVLGVFSVLPIDDFEPRYCSDI